LNQRAARKAALLLFGRPRYIGAALAAGAEQEACMNQIIYLVGVIVVVMLILSFFGLR
jgi:hypothetical protein